jgi:hypothetical protein
VDRHGAVHHAEDGQPDVSVLHRRRVDPDPQDEQQKREHVRDFPPVHVGEAKASPQTRRARLENSHLIPK